jgi:hypothetical protein
MLALLLVVALGAPAPASARAMVGVSQEWAEALAHKLQAALQAPRGRPNAALVVTEGELNSYLNITLRSKLPPELSELRLRFERDRLSANALVDFDLVKAKLPSLGPFNPLSFMTGKVQAVAAGRLSAENGFGNVQFEELRLGSVPIPMTLVEQAVAASTRSAEQPQGVDVHAPFRLPYGIKRVRLQAGKALLEY